MSTLPTTNLARLSELAFEQRGDYPALLFEERWHSSRELFDRASRLAGGLVELGVRPGDRVIVCMGNCPEVGIAYESVWRAGAVVTPVMFLLSASELRHVISDSEACVVITTAEFVEKVSEAAAGIDSVRAVICDGEADNTIALSAVEQASPLAIVDRAEDDLAALLYTGGTTGRAKGVMLSHGNLLYSGQTGYRDTYFEGLTNTMLTLPLSHNYGIAVTIGTMFSPERVVTVLLRWFASTTFLEHIERERVQLSGIVPSMMQRILAEPLENYDLSSLRFVTCGSAPLTRAMADEFERRIPSVRIREGYGLTETSALVAVTPVQDNKFGSVGRPVSGTEVAIFDDEDKPLPLGEAGEICCRSPAVTSGYWRSPEITADALRNGWLHTGDVGYLDEDGFLFIVDRKKDLIIRGGFNVYPRDVEDALLEHPAVATAGVVGRPDEQHGEEVVAFVSLAQADVATEAELVAWARERIGGYKYPREVHIVDSLPLTAVGKLDRKVLRTLVNQEA
jgi:long-chain acyl-CoA synthetase